MQFLNEGFILRSFFYIDKGYYSNVTGSFSEGFEGSEESEGLPDIIKKTAF